MTRNRLVQIAVVVLLIAFFVLSRAWKLGESCLWFDEIFSVHAATQPWNSVLSFVALDLIHPPLFYILLKLWSAAGGESVWYLRTLPLLFSMLTFVPFALLVKELRVNFKCWLLAFCFLMISGTFLKYSIELRMYSLLVLLAVSSIWLFTRYLNCGLGVIPLLAVNILLVYTHYFGWLILLSEFVAILVLDREKVLRFAAIIGATLLASSPWAFAVWQAAGKSQGLSQNIGWMSRPGIREISGLAFNLVEPFYYQTGSSQSISFFVVTIPLLGICAVTLAVVVSEWKEISSEIRKQMLLLTIFIAVPVSMAFAGSWLTPYSIWGTRHLIIILVPFYTLLSVMLSNLRERRIRIGFGSIAAILFCIAVVNQFRQDRPRYSWCELPPLTAGVSGSAMPIYAVEDLVAYHLWFENRKDPSPAKVMKLHNVDGVREDKAYFLPRGFEDVGRVDLDGFAENRFWLVHRAPILKESEAPLRNLTVKGYRITSTKTIAADGESVGLYLLER